MKQDNDLLLFDRLEVIKSTNKKYDLDHNAYISFSGGKDSTVLHHLIDLALPNNRIPRVFINTGIEYNDIVAYVKDLASKDDRFIIINQTQSIKKVLEEKGYPFKSKEHSNYLSVYQHSGIESKTVDRYLNPSEKRKNYGCPIFLKYQFTKEFNLKISNLCCFKLKKEPIKKWQKQTNRPITLTGMRKDEGGTRANIKGCILTDKANKLIKFHPLLVVNEDFENWFIERNNIKLCKLYYEPFNFKRTGCKGCPFALDLQNQLDKMGKLLPNERKQCELIWKPVYDEYRRLNYRLLSEKQTNIFDYMNDYK